MIENEQAPVGRGARSRWPFIVVGLLATHVTVMLLAVKIASSGGGHAVVPDYYQKAVHWDDARAAARASDLLRWSASVTPSVLTGSSGQRELRFVLTGSDGRPIEGARVVARVWHHAIGKLHEVSASEAETPGVYVASAPMALAGTWECEFVADRGDDHFIQTVTLHIASPLADGAAGL